MKLRSEIGACTQCTDDVAVKTGRKSVAASRPDPTNTLAKNLPGGPVGSRAAAGQRRMIDDLLALASSTWGYDWGQRVLDKGSPSSAGR